MQTLIVDAALIPQEVSHFGGVEPSSLTQTLNALKAPHLKAWISGAQEIQGSTLGEESLNTPLEEGIRQCLVEPVQKNQLGNGLTGQAHALALRCLPKEDSATPPGLGWALMSLCHWHVNSGQVFMLGCEPLDEQRSDALQSDLVPFFAQVGISLFKHKPGVWLAKSELFHELPTTSLARAMGQEVQPWLVGNTLAFPKERMSQSQALKRLQSEVQMLLYNHPINEKKVSPLNSIWFSDTGTSCLQTQHIQWLESLLPNTRLETFSPSQIWVSEHLRFSYRQGDWRAWASTLESLDAQLFGEMNSPLFDRLIFCGSQSTRVWVKRPQKGLASFWSSLKESVFSRSSFSSVFHEN